PNQNQNAQLTYDEDTGFFSLKVRKDLGLMKDETDKFFTLEHLNFKHHRQKLIETMKEAKTPITIRILRRENKWYMQVIFTWVSEPNTQVTKSEYGSIGLDFNDGFIEASEVDHYGNLVYQVHYKLKHHGTGNKAKSEMQVIAKKLSDYALEVMKPIVIEDLNFKKTKAKTSKNTTGKTYNKMLHAFDYSRYKKLLENVCHRKKLELIFVNPAYTSIIGERKFGNRMKLNRHQAASFVIARRGIGFVDNI
ncbi:MAG: IS200/IS605 family accessory protein TnpB-related protein, partial [Streptococcaceae bacterium]|nr:IS200/IS605 family accessory protein TnpB-related protein [Streptococcaceae bacterium]